MQKIINAISFPTLTGFGPILQPITAVSDGRIIAALAFLCVLGLALLFSSFMANAGTANLFAGMAGTAAPALS